MPKIGKAIFVGGGLIFDFTLTVNGTDYHIDKDSASSSVADVYTYVREDKGWYLIVYATATLTFAKLKHLVDICCVGGGGGGGGGTCGGSGYSQGGRNGGAGGGGYYQEDTTRALGLNTSYALTIGAGGAGGAGAPGSRWADAANGSNGSATSFGRVLTANGGGYGQGATDDYSGADGAGGDRQYCFSDSTYPEVSGKSGRKTTTSGIPGVGGGYGGWNSNYYGDPSSFGGDKGANGLIMIRSSR